MLDILILYSLLKHNSTLYKCKKLIEAYFYPFMSPSLGAINPAIKRLQKNNYVEIEETMSEGGLKSTIISITLDGEKYLKNQLLNFKFKTATNFLENAMMYIYCSQILNNNEYNEFKKNLEIQIKLYKNLLKKNMQSPYNMESARQRVLYEAVLKFICEVDKICQEG